MKTKKIIFAAFALIIVLIPMYLIFQSEDVLTNGHQHKLRLEGYDPFDPFRGKFLRLRFENSIPCESDLKTGDQGFVLLEKDTSGFSHFSFVQKKRPSHSDYVEAKVMMVYGGKAEMDFDNLNKFFINEDKAKEAEEIMADYTRMAPDKIHLTIRVLDGEARIEDIIVKAKKLLDYIASGEHKHFKEDILKEMMERMNSETEALEQQMEQLEELEQIDFAAPEIDD
ncbi:MAG: GDYXXLXY domain-containing protein [Bacteroidota bacterium]